MSQANTTTVCEECDDPLAWLSRCVGCDGWFCSGCLTGHGSGHCPDCWFEREVQEEANDQ